MNSFDQSLAIGKQSEELVLDFIRKKYPCYKLEGYCKQADLVFYREGKWEWAEVKQDFKSDHSWRWVIEVCFWWKPSWLSTTGSTYWILVDSTSMNFITPMNIYRCITINAINRSFFTWPWDIYQKDVYFIPKSILQEYVSFVIPY